MLNAIRSNPLPEQRIARRANSEAGQQIEIGIAFSVSTALQLIDEPISNAVDRTLDTAPQLECRLRMHGYGTAPPGSGESLSGGPTGVRARHEIGRDITVSSSTASGSRCWAAEAGAPSASPMIVRICSTMASHDAFAARAIPAARRAGSGLAMAA